MKPTPFRDALVNALLDRAADLERVKDPRIRALIAGLAEKARRDRSKVSNEAGGSSEAA